MELISRSVLLGVGKMPAKSEKQRRLIQAVKHDPAVARKTGISRAAAKKVLGEGEGSGSSGKAYRAAGPEPKSRYSKD